MRVSAMAGVSFYDALDLVSYADGIRLINQWWLDVEGGGRLRTVGTAAPRDISGLFSR